VGEKIEGGLDFLCHFLNSVTQYFMKIYVALKDAKNKIKIKINNPNQQLPTRNICFQKYIFSVLMGGILNVEWSVA
jgi:hypothetical protein